MQFNPRNFRRISDDSKPSFKIRTADFTTMILVKSSGDAMYGRTRGDKDDIVKNFDETSDMLLWVWVGQYRTDIFLLTMDDIKNHYA